MEQPPHPMRLGDDEGDYYRGIFSGSTSGPAAEAPAARAPTADEGGR
jgi:hypothetical protein